MKKKDLVDQLVSEIETGKVRTLGIYGHGASGKSTFAQELYQALDSTTVNLLETDPYITSERHLVVPKDAPNQKVTACLPVAHELLPLPPYSSEYNPIEKTWAHIKKHLKNVLPSCNTFYESLLSCSCFN